MRRTDDANREDTPDGLPVLERATLVLNRSWTPVHVTTVRRALCLVFRESARIVDPTDYMTFSFAEWVMQPLPAEGPTIRSPALEIAPPEVVVLARYNRVPSHDAPFTRRNLFLRDDYTCQYCARRLRPDRLSVDHVVPRSRGGATNWENCVLACIACNARKADQPLRDAGLALLREPEPPRWTPYLNIRPSQRLESWDRFAGRRERRANS